MIICRTCLPVGNKKALTRGCRTIRIKYMKKKFSVAEVVNNDGCFDLQFRKDTRKERTNSPTYYRWKAQFVVTTKKDSAKILQKIKKELCCGQVCAVGNQARFSVQNIGDIFGAVIPYFRKNSLQGNKKRDFMLWEKAVEIIQKNKGKPMQSWKKNELASLIEIQKSSAKYKIRQRQPKWLQMAKTFAKTA